MINKMTTSYTQLQFPFFVEDQIIPDSISSDRVIVNHQADWETKKSTMGIIRNDLTRTLTKNSDGFPIVKPYMGEFPSELVEIGKLNRAKKGAWLNGFSEDVILDRIWKRTAFYLSKIPEGGGFIAPDFSLKLQMSPIEKQFNIFRRNALAAFAQQYDIPTILPLTWAEYDSYDYCFSGIVPGGIYAISNIGTRNNYISRKLFISGLKEAIRLLTPIGLVLYGYPMENSFDVPIHLYSNPNF